MTFRLARIVLFFVGDPNRAHNLRLAKFRRSEEGRRARQANIALRMNHHEARSPAFAREPHSDRYCMAGGVWPEMKARPVAVSEAAASFAEITAGVERVA
jgi:hypothetical protein